MALSKQWYKEEYKDLSIKELKKRLKANRSIFNRLFVRILEGANKKQGIDDNSPISDNNAEYEAIRELIVEKDK